MSDSDIYSDITAVDPPSPPPQETTLTLISAPPPPMEESAANPSPNAAASSLWPPDSDISFTTTAADLPSPRPLKTILAPTSAATPPMEESAANPSPNAASSPSPITFSLWPPSQRTRDAVIARLIETLSTPSVLSKRYGTLPPEEASEAARSIEEEAFNTAGGTSTPSPDEEGLQILQIYSKEISKRMLDSVKAHSAASEGGGATVVNEKDAAEEEADSEVKAEA